MNEIDKYYICDSCPQCKYHRRKEGGWQDDIYCKLTDKKVNNPFTGGHSCFIPSDEYIDSVKRDLYELEEKRERLDCRINYTRDKIVYLENMERKLKVKGILDEL